MDVLWTAPAPGIAAREHQLVVAVLSTGPVGFGDSLPGPGFRGTNATRLLLASRLDGRILKPAHPALQLDALSAVWAAPSVPARPPLSPSTDPRANSFARLLPPSGQAAAGGRWWYSILATDVNTTISPEMLFPVPRGPMVAHQFGRTCVNGTLARECLRLFSVESPLQVRAGGWCDQPPCRHWALFNVAPILPGGWVLLGEHSKYVAVSPQRLLSAVASDASAMVVDALLDGELAVSASGFRFKVSGSHGEVVRIFVVCPGQPQRSNNLLEDTLSGTIVSVDIKFASDQTVSEVYCDLYGCSVRTHH